MTVLDNYAPAIFTGNDITTVFPFSFVVYDETHLKVYEVLIATGVRTLISAANYTVSGVPGAGSITYEPLGSPLSSLKKLEIHREVPYTQDLDIENQGGFFANTLEQQLDLTTMQIQQLAEESEHYIELTEAVERAETAADEAEAAAAIVVGLTPPAFPATRAALAALDVAAYSTAYLVEAGRTGLFKLVTTVSVSTWLAADPTGIIVVQSTNNVNWSWLRADIPKLNALWAGFVDDGADSLDAGSPTLVRGGWVTATAYALHDLVWSGGLGYRCISAHTSGTFATDLAAGKWVLGAFSGTDNTAAFAALLALHEVIGIGMLIPAGKYRLLNPSSTADSAYLTLTAQKFDLRLDGTLLIDEDGTAGKGYNLFKSSNFGTATRYDERTMFRIRGVGGFRGRWSHKPGGNTPNARAHIVAIAGYKNVHLEGFFYEDIAGSFSRATKLDGVYANNVRGERVAKGGLRFHDTNDARVVNNKLRHHGDDAIDLHAGTAKVRSRIYIAGNQLFDCETVIALGAREISVIGNQSTFGKSGAFYIGGRVSDEGDNAAMMIVVSGNTVTDPLMASTDAVSLATHTDTQGGIVIGSVQASWRAGDYNGASVNDPLSASYYDNIDLDTTNVPQGGSIEVYGNPVRHTVQNASKFSDYGYGPMFHQDGWFDPAIDFTKRVPNGVVALSDIENFRFDINVSGFRAGAGILFRFLQTTEATRNFSFRNGRVSGVVRDCLAGMSHSFWNGSAQVINFQVHFENLHCDLDPYHVSAARSTATGGNWNSGAAAEAKNYGARLASMRGFTMKGCSFKNCYAPVYGDTNYEYGLYRNNVIYGTRAIAGHSASNFGVGEMVWSNDQFDLIEVASVPSAGSGTYDVFSKVVRREGSVTLADDTATSFVPPRPQGTLRIVSNANGAVADFAYDVSAGAIVAVGASGSSVTLGTTALAGTTGTDVRANYAAVNDGKIYIENRLGSSRTFRYLFLDG